MKKDVAQMNETIGKWQTLGVFDEATRQAVQNGAWDEGAFDGELSFGTGGLRGVMGIGTNRMNVYTVAKATQGLSDYLNKAGAKAVAIAYDTRNNSKSFAEVAAGVLAKNGLLAYAYNRPMPTPMLSYAVREMHCDAGVVITASHNPAVYNGYKVYGADGCQITDGAAREITECIEAVAYEDLSWLSPNQARAEGLYADIDKTVYDSFIEKTMGVLEGLFEGEGEINLVYTPLNGAGLEPVTDVLKRMKGVSFSLVKEQEGPDGNFPTCPSPNPEAPDALTLAIAKAKAEQADLVIATDPDCDRLGVAVKSGDTYHRLTGNEVGLLLLEMILSEKSYPQAPTVIKTIVTTDLAWPIAAHYHANVQEVLTGFKYIGEKIGQMERAGESHLFAFGFEESCGYLAAPHVRDKDGVMAAALVVHLAKRLKAKGETLLTAMNRIYQTYGYLENKLLNFELSGVHAKAQMALIMKRLREKPLTFLAGEQITGVKDYADGLDGLPKSDVLCYMTRGGSKAIVRPSGTEPKVKVYLFGKGASRDEAAEKVNEMEKTVSALFD